MSVDGTKLLFEGFLQKRKDNLVSYISGNVADDSELWFNWLLCSCWT